MSRDTESLTTIPAPGPPAVPAAVMGTRGFPELSQGQDGGSVPRLSPGQAGGKRTGSGGKAPGSATRQHPTTPPPNVLDRPQRRRMGGGSGSREGAGTAEGTRKRCRSRKFSITAVVPPPPPGAVRHGPPAARRGGTGSGRAALRRLPAQPRGAQGRRRRACFRRSGDRNEPGAQLGGFWAGAGSCPAHLPVRLRTRRSATWGARGGEGG